MARRGCPHCNVRWTVREEDVALQMADDGFTLSEITERLGRHTINGVGNKLKLLKAKREGRA